MSSAARIRLPGWMAQRASDVLEGRKPPVEPRDAATVMLLRPLLGGAGPDALGVPDAAAPLDAAARPEARDAQGLQVYMLRRQPSMAFAPGAFVFPVGSVDTRDAEIEV